MTHSRLFSAPSSVTSIRLSPNQADNTNKLRIIIDLLSRTTCEEKTMFLLKLVL